MDRRRFLELAAAAAVLSPLALSASPAPRRRLLQMNGYAPDAETPLDLLNDYLTPNDLFFVRHHWNVAEMPDAKTWALAVDGEVSSPLSLSLSDLKAMPRAEATCVLQCAGNGRGLYKPVVPGVQWKYGAVGNAKWTGVRVKDVLEKAGLQGTAKHLHTFGTDKPPGKVPPFHRSVELEKILADGILAFEMNGEPLPPLHGAPVRLVVPGWAGDHWMKWITRISAQSEPQHGFYVDTAYRYPKTPGAPGVAFKPEEMTPVTELFVKSNWTLVPANARVGRETTLKGFAFSGAPDVAKVEVSEDGGASWKNAELDPRHDPFAWRRFFYRWKPAKAGSAALLCRATDSRGSMQPKEAVWNQSGYLYNAWHEARVEVKA